MSIEEVLTTKTGTPGRLISVLVVTALLVVAGTAGLALVAGLGPFEGSTDSEEPPEGSITEVSGTDPVTVAYRNMSGDTERFEADAIDPELINETEQWAFIERDSLPESLERVADDPDRGVITMGSMALVGEMTSGTEPVGSATVTVAAPSGEPVDAEEMAYFLSEFVSPYKLAPDDDQVTIIAAPRTFVHRGAMFDSGTGYVTPNAFWDGDVDSEWIHEFLHARQHVPLEQEMKWYDEATAEYLTYRILQEQYTVTNDDIRTRLAAYPEYPDAVLSNVSTWGSGAVDYHRGARLMYTLDAHLRAETDGDHTLFDVFYAMNERDSAVSIDDFREIVEDFTGGDESWLAVKLTESGPMDGYLDADHSVFEEP